MRRALPRDGVLSFDVGAHTHQIASQWTAHAPKTFHITNGWSSMGFGLPGAIAAKLARPDLPVVCLIGDGCFQMTCGEVAVAKRLGLTLPIVVLDDRWLALIKVKQIRRQFPLYGTELQAEDYREPPSALFRRAGGRRAQRRRAGSAVTQRARRQGPDRDRGGGRFRPLCRHGLRLSVYCSSTSLPRSCVQRTLERNDMPSRLTLSALSGWTSAGTSRTTMSPTSTMPQLAPARRGDAVRGADLDGVVALRGMDAEPRRVALAQRDCEAPVSTTNSMRRPSTRASVQKCPPLPRVSTTLRELAGDDAASGAAVIALAALGARRGLWSMKRAASTPTTSSTHGHDEDADAWSHRDVEVARDHTTATAQEAANARRPAVRFPTRW